MTALKLPAWFPMTLVAGVLMAVFVFLYVGTRDTGKSDYFENVSRLRHLKQLNAQAELDAMKSRTGINTHYDALAGSLTELATVLDQLESSTATQEHVEADLLSKADIALREAMDEKLSLIERFKSDNSVLRNSLSFLPIAAQEALHAMEKLATNALQRSVALHASVTLNNVLLACMLYSQNASDEQAARILHDLRELDIDASALPSAARGRLVIFGAHARTILREQVTVASLLGAVVAVPVADRIDDINNLVVSEQQRAAVDNERHRNYLLAFSAVLIGLLLFTAARLLHAHAVVRNSNEQLVKYGRGLESMVADRVADLRASEARMTRLAQYDSLTELPNRHLFRDRLSQAMARADRYRRLMALIFVDLDHFKQINDSEGHVVGDEVLKAVAERLRQSMRHEDTVARLGGDEFTIILENLETRENAIQVAAKINEALVRPLVVDGRSFTVRASMGIATYTFDSNDGNGLLQAADIAMYRAKEGGRNACVVFAPDMAVRISERVNMETLLRHALQRGEFHLLYQPKVELATGRIAGVEALLRWNSAELGAVPPAQFIPLAEETGLIASIGEWVLHTACMQGAAWAREGLPPLTMAVNLSPCELRDPHLITRIARVLKESGYAADRLELELTEGVIMDNVAENIDTLTAIRDLGVSLAIDDFGTGYSSLAYLVRLPIQTLKIDRAFITSMLDDANATTLVSTIVTLAHSLRLEVVAEGVETARQRSMLESLGCDQIQGFACSRPIAADALARLVRSDVGSAPFTRPCVPTLVMASR